MSEIIGSVYEQIEKTGCKEGILFIDEINCVSETLAPTMLQFLQCKTFGNQQVPEGWIIVAAGNPPEYNKSVREFDVVTLDRVKKIDVASILTDADFAVENAPLVPLDDAEPELSFCVFSTFISSNDANALFAFFAAVSAAVPIPSVSAADMVAPSCPTVRVYSSKHEVSLNSVFTGYRFAPIS